MTLILKDGVIITWQKCYNNQQCVHFFLSFVSINICYTDNLLHSYLSEDATLNIELCRFLRTKAATAYSAS